MISRMRTGWSRAQRGVAALIVGAILLYAGVAVLYGLSNSTSAGSSCPAEPPAEEITLVLTPQSVDAAGDRIKAALDVDSFGPAAPGAGERLTAPLTVYLSRVESARSIVYPPGGVPSVQALSMVSEGDVENWPFDRQTVRMSVVAVLAEGTEQAEVIPVLVCGTAHVPGWSFTSTTHKASSEDFEVDGKKADELEIVAQRSPATVVFGIAILALMVVLPVIGLMVAILVLRGRRKAEATLMSWIAAMLFATIPMRNFLPGSPPVGSWVDYLVVLWVVAGLIAALVVYVVGWLRWAPSGDGSPRHPPATGGS